MDHVEGRSHSPPREFRKAPRDLPFWHALPCPPTCPWFIKQTGILQHGNHLHVCRQTALINQIRLQGSTRVRFCQTPSLRMDATGIESNRSHGTN